MLLAKRPVEYHETLKLNFKAQETTGDHDESFAVITVKARNNPLKITNEMADMCKEG